MTKWSILIAAMIAFSTAASDQECFQTDYKKQLTGYQLHLSNQCKTPVTWSYSACLENSTIQDDKVTLSPAQTRVVPIKHRTQEPILLYYQACENCVASTPVCDGDYYLPEEEWDEFDEFIMFYQAIGKMASEEKVRILSAELPRLNVTPAQRQLTFQFKKKPGEPVSGKEIYQKLTSLSEPQKTSPLLSPKPVIAKKPTSSTGQLNSQAFNTIAPVTPVPADNGTMPAMKPTKNSRTKAASCVTHKLGERNILGRSVLTLNNLCPQTVNIGLRICTDNKVTLQTVLKIGPEDDETKWIAHEENETVNVKYSVCQGEQCTPQIPMTCSE